jgi:hypothetical protein
MTSLRQLDANRRNSLKSTGPRTEAGKEQSRRNATRHGLTAETVIEALEDVEDYRGFEANILADYGARTAVERELVMRLASLLWRLRRATGIETDLLRIQAEILRERAQAVKQGGEPDSPPPNPIYRAFCAVIPQRWAQEGDGSADEARDDSVPAIDTLAEDAADPIRTLTYCFLRLAHLDSGAFKRLNRYEAGLWRQAVQVMAALRAFSTGFHRPRSPISCRSHAGPHVCCGGQRTLLPPSE